MANFTMTINFAFAWWWGIQCGRRNVKYDMPHRYESPHEIPTYRPTLRWTRLL